MMRIVNFEFDDATTLHYVVPEDSFLTSYRDTAAGTLSLLSVNPQPTSETEHGKVWEELLLWGNLSNYQLNWPVRRNQVLYATPLVGAYPFLSQLLLDNIQLRIP